MDHSPILLIIAGIVLAGSAWAAIVSVREREPRAAGLAGVLAVAAPIPCIVVALMDFPGRDIAAWFLIALPVAAFLLWALPIRGSRYEHAEAVERIDERTVMFARNTLEPGTERFDAHYREFPEHREADDKWRARPGLLGKDARHHHGRLFAAAESGYATMEALHALVDGDPSPRAGEEDPAALTRFLHGWLKTIGASSSGVTVMRPEHWYTVTGRRAPYGVPAELPHAHALAFTVEMDKDMLDRAPKGPVIAETTQQYLNAAVTAVQVALFLRSRGFSARAHIDANYRVVCPLVARDAGLGEIGRMGLLMTPNLGPRVRIGVVTTDAPLVPSPPTRDESVLDFCTICKKCADICPSAAIMTGPRVDIDGVTRWQIDQEACFSYWCSVGTDCGRCVQVCPYSHPDNLLHGLVRSGVRRSAAFRRVALELDSVFYGRRPPSRELEDWMGEP
jgi:reductive dehalogenase